MLARKWVVTGMLARFVPPYYLLAPSPLMPILCTHTPGAQRGQRLPKCQQRTHLPHFFLPHSALLVAGDACFGTHSWASDIFLRNHWFYVGDASPHTRCSAAVCRVWGLGIRVIPTPLNPPLSLGLRVLWVTRWSSILIRALQAVGGLFRAHPMRGVSTIPGSGFSPFRPRHAPASRSRFRFSAGPGPNTLLGVASR